MIFTLSEYVECRRWLNWWHVDVAAAAADNEISTRVCCGASDSCKRAAVPVCLSRRHTRSTSTSSQRRATSAVSLRHRTDRLLLQLTWRRLHWGVPRDDVISSWRHTLSATTFVLARTSLLLHCYYTAHHTPKGGSKQGCRKGFKNLGFKKLQKNVGKT